jgi:hypothetical protein
MWKESVVAYFKVLFRDSSGEIEEMPKRKRSVYVPRFEISNSIISNGSANHYRITSGRHEFSHLSLGFYHVSSRGVLEPK